MRQAVERVAGCVFGSLGKWMVTMRRTALWGLARPRRGWALPLVSGMAGLSSGSALGAALLLSAPVDLAPRPMPGVREFSGQVIAKPKAGVLPGALPPGAAVMSVVSETGEWIVRVPVGVDDGRFAMSLAAGGRFEYAEPDWKVFLQDVPNDPMFGTQWHHTRMQDPLAWSTWTGGGITVGVVDSGVDLTHPDLASRLVSGYNAVTKVAQAAGGDVSDISTIGHGSAVAGCVGAAGNNGVGVTGVSWNVRLMPVRASNDPTGSAVLSNVLNGCRWAVDHGAKVINASYAGVNAMSVETTGAYVRDHGGILVWASGNNGSVLGATVDWPDVVIVGATDKNDARPTWSNFGAAIDLVAPGVAISTTTRNGGYSSYDGTSFASPLVAGVMALAWSVDPALPRSTVLASVLSTCQDLGAAGEDDYTGAGIVDTDAAIMKTWREAHVLTPPVTDLVDEGPVDTIRWPVRNSAAIQLVHFGDDLNAFALPMVDGDVLESTSIDLSASDPDKTQLRIWSFRAGDAGIDVQYQTADGSWAMLVDHTVVVDGPFEHAWSLPVDAMHSRFAVRIAASAAPGSEVYVTTFTVGERCNADFDGSGFVDTDDFTTFVTAFELGSSEADVDLSGFVDTDDFTMFVMSFSEGC